MQLPQSPARLASACLLAIGLAGCQTGGHGLLSCLCPKSPAPSQSSCGQCGCAETACTSGQCGPHGHCTDTACQTTHGHTISCAATAGCQSSCASTASCTHGGCTNGCVSQGCVSNGCVSHGCVSNGCAAVAVPHGGAGECLLEPEPPSRQLGQPAPMAPLTPQNSAAPMVPQQTPRAPQAEQKPLPPAAAEQAPAEAHRTGEAIPPAATPAWRFDNQAPPPPLPTGAMLQRPAIHQVTIAPAGSAASFVTFGANAQETVPVPQSATIQPSAPVLEEIEPMIPAAPIATPALDATPLSPQFSPQPIEVLQPIAPIEGSTGANLSKPWADALGLDASDARREVPAVCNAVPLYRGRPEVQYASEVSPATSQPVLRVVNQSKVVDQPARY